MFDNYSNNRLEAENKQLRLQLETKSDQALKFKEIAESYKKEYEKLSKKVTSFCSCITSLTYAKQQIGGKNKLNTMSIDDLLGFAIDEYNKQKKEFQDLALEMSEKIDEKDKIIQDLQTQISVYEIDRSAPPHISNGVIGGDAYVPPMMNNVGIPDLPPIEDNELSLSMADDSDFQPIGLPDIPTGLPDIPPVGMPPIDDVPTGVPPINNSFPKNPMNAQSQQKTAPTFATKGKGKSLTVEDDDLDSELNVDENSRIQIARQDVDGVSPMTPPDFSVVNPNNVVTEDKRQMLMKKIQQDNEQKMHMIDINPLIADIRGSEIALSLFSLIGERGLSQMPQIKEALEKSSIEKGGKSSINAQINNMIRSKILARENVNTGYRRFIVIDFTPIGVRIFEEIFKKSPVESERRRLQRENASLEHGYLIQDTMTILQKEFGYGKLIIDRKQNSIKLSNNRTYIPDIVATIDGKNWDYIEVERGTHTQKDFNDKLDKMLCVTRTFYFVSQNQEMLDVVIEKTTKWIEERGKNNLKGLTIKFSTLSHLSKRNWSKIISL